MFIQIEPDNFLNSITSSDAKTIIISSINYEDRSIALTYLLIDTIKKIKDVSFNYLILQSKFHSVRVLEQLKLVNIKKIEKTLENTKFDKEILAYPDFYESRSLEGIIEKWFQTNGDDMLNILIDISVLPRAVIIDFAEVVDKLYQFHKNKIKNIFLTYTEATHYPQLRYPFNPGKTRLHFKAKAVSSIIDKTSEVTAIIFPGIQGYEGKLFFDELSTTKGSKYLFVYSSRRDLLTSMYIMRANLSLFELKDINLRYYFSIYDGYKKLTSVLEEEKSKLSPNSIILIGTFAQRPFAWAAYHLKKELEVDNDGLFLDVVLLSGFQYNSVYSRGTGESIFFKIY